jgi:hypothetical protein
MASCSRVAIGRMFSQLGEGTSAGPITATGPTTCPPRLVEPTRSEMEAALDRRLRSRRKARNGNLERS